MKNISKEDHIARLTFQVGDLIHYQDNDYRSEYPKDAEIYNNIGTILRHLGETDREFFTVENLIEQGSSIKHIIPKEVIQPLKSFNSIMLVDLVSRMQGKTKDDTFLETVDQVKSMYN